MAHVSARIQSVAIVLLVLSALIPPAGAASTSLVAPGGGIVFTFSSGWATGMLAADTLEAHGMRGTFYVSSGLLRQGSYYAAYLSAAEVASLATRGHDVESMTVTAPDLTTLDATRLAHELSSSKASLETITGRAVDHLAYPFGATNDAVASATAAHYASGRTISWTIDDFGGSVDAHHLPAFIMRKETSLGEAKWIVDQAVARNVVIVLSFERIVASPGTYDWTQADLDALAAYVQAKGVRVRTVSELVTGAPPAPVTPTTTPGASRGAVVFTFDDGPSNHVLAAKILADRGARGTFYVMSDCPRSEISTPECLSPKQVKALSAAGHDIESHTVLHRDLTLLSPTALRSELTNAQTALQRLTGKPVVHLAYPYGAHNAVVRTQADVTYATGRIYLTNPAPEDLPALLAQSGADPMLIPGIGVTMATSLARAKAYVDHAASSNVTIVLAFHDIVSPPADPYSWSPSDLAALADHAKARGVPIRTMAQAYGG